MRRFLTKWRSMNGNILRLLLRVNHLDPELLPVPRVPSAHTVNIRFALIVFLEHAEQQFVTVGVCGRFYPPQSWRVSTTSPLALLIQERWLVYDYDSWLLQPTQRLLRYILRTYQKKYGNPCTTTLGFDAPTGY